MSDFSLQCWVPSLSAYERVKELSLDQYSIISKFILNNDNKGLGSYFEEVLFQNFLVKDTYTKLTKYDKWFVLTFLRAVNLSSTLTLKAKDEKNKDCTYDIDLLTLLTKASDFKPIDKFQINLDLVTLEIGVENKIYSVKDNFNFIKKIIKDSKVTIIEKLDIDSKNTLLNQLKENILPVVQKIIEKKESYNKQNFKLIPVSFNLKEVYEVGLTLFDNAIFDFLKLIYSPFAKGVYAKKYFLTSKLKFNLSEIERLTPLECDIYINLYNQENTSKIKANQSIP